MRRPILIAALASLGASLGAGLCAVHAHAQSSIDNNGNCNVNIIGSGNNNLTIQCANPNAAPQDRALLVFTNNSMFPVGGLNMQFINGPLSNISITLEDEVVLESDLGSAMRSTRKRLDRGQYYYEITIDISFWNGKVSSATCGGIIDVQTSAVIMPRIVAIANMNGDLFPQSCGFELRM